MDKIDHKSRDILGGNVEKIAELFPGVVTEAQDEATGELKKVVDFDLLRQHLSDELVEGDRERFRLDWPGKKASILKANTPITKTLRPVREDSVDFDTTENVFIEGDNFEVLKVLQESYLGKIKMIYIDPPYNTGKDFIYKDKFAQTKDDYEEEIGVYDDDTSGRLIKNTDNNGHFHSDWLSMMLERLTVARDLLTDDGVLAVSIDENEISNLTQLCDEVFGESNRMNVIAVKMSELSGVKMKHVSKFPKLKEYIVVYTKDIESVTVTVPKLQKSRDALAAYSRYYSSVIKNPDSRPEDWEIVSVNDYLKDSGVMVSGADELLDWKIKNASRVVYRTNSRTVTSFLRDNPGASEIFKFINSDGGEVIKWGNKEMLFLEKYLEEYLGDIWMDISTINLNKETVGLPVFSNGQKPLALIERLLNSFTSEADLVMDFFSGSSSTAHAVMQLNARGNKSLKHIQVQLAEQADEASEAYKAGFKTIPEFSRERIRRAAKKIREDYAEQIAKRETPLDTGFRAYKLSSSNFIDTTQHPAQTTQASLLDTTDNIKDDRTPEDLLTEVILDLGLTLDLPIEQRDIAGHSLFFVGGNSLVACFDDKVTLDIVDGIAAENPLRIVFKDSSFANDETRINIDIRLKQLSPDTTVQVV